MELRNKHILVMGLGLHDGGLGVTRFLVEQGAHVTVTDLRSAEVLQPSLTALQGLPVTFVLGEHRAADFRNADMVIRNPGVPRGSPFLQLAREAGATIEMEMSLFFRLCPGPILGITGTRGKTTTTLLAGAMLREQFPDTVIAGNLRVSALEQLPRITATTPVVLELSSWQLEGLGEAELSPAFADVTNMSPDHLNTYQDMDDYAAAKREIVAHQGADGLAVLNANDPVVAPFARAVRGRCVWVRDALAADVRPADAPNAGEVLVDADGIHADLAGVWTTICGVQDVQLPGRHNLLNVAHAAALALAFGVTIANVRTAIQGFRGVPHRMELVRELHGVRFINDTTATTPTATIAALQALAAPVVLIAGGADKKLPLDTLPAVIAARVKDVVLLAGTATPRLQAALAAYPTVALTAPFADFAEAIQVAQQLAGPGDVVLLSPACASFGMFKHEFDRGDQFRALVEQLV